MIPEANNPIPQRFKSGTSFGVIAFLFGVLPAISFNNQLGFETNKIDDVGLNNDLTSELVTLQAASSKMPPQQLFGIGGVPAQCAGT